MSEAAATAPAPRRAAFAFIFVTVMLDMLALGLVVPVLPQLILQFEGGDTADAAHVVGILGALWATMQFLSMPVMGALSDQVGRRPVILVSNFGLALAYAMVAAAPSLVWLFVARAVNGICAASVSTANAYVADVTAPDKRAAAFGMLGAAFGAGFILGPAIGGLLGADDPRLPFWVAAGMSLANGLYGLFVLPESLPVDRRSRFSWRRANPVAAFGFLNRRPAIRGLATSRFLEGLAQVVLPTIFVLYATHRYGWDTRTIGLTLAGAGLGSVLVNAGLVRHAVRIFGERRALLIGLACGTAGFAIYGLAPEGWIFLLGLPIAALLAFSGASAQAILSRQVGPEEQGQLQGALAALIGVAGMIGPLTFTAVYAAALDGTLGFSLPGAPLLAAAGLLAAAWVIARRATRGIAT